MSTIRLESVDKVHVNGRYPVKGFNMTVPDGALVALVGPATSGKTAVLQMIAGLDAPTAGNIYIDERLVNEVPAKDREVAVISKEHMVYPELSVHDNIALGLKLKRLNPEEIEDRIRAVLELMDIAELSERRAETLDQVETQRVSLARFAVRKPKAILLDDPFSALELDVKDALLKDLALINARLGITMVYCSGNVQDARKLGGLICVIHRGLFQQMGTWHELTQTPKTSFVAGYIGDVLTNYLEVVLEQGSAGIWARLGEQRFKLPDTLVLRYRLLGHVGETCQLGILAEDVTFSRKAGSYSLQGRIFAKEVHDNKILWSAKTENVHIMSTSFEPEIRLNEDAWLNLNLDRATVQLR